MATMITEQHARKVIEVVDAGLVKGLGEAEPGQMCVEAAVCYALGLPHGDDPECVAPALRALKIALNDASWSTNAARANGLRRLAVLQLGSAGVLDEAEFVKRVVEQTILVIVPIALRAAASKRSPMDSEALEAAALRCEAEGTTDAAVAAVDAANAAYAANAADAAVDAANAAVYAAVYAADAANAAVYAAYAADAAAYSADAAIDAVMGRFAALVEQVLIDMNVPGCAWLPLLDEVR